MSAADDAKIKELSEKLATGSRILDYLKLAAPFGHISVRVPETDTFLTTRAIAPGIVTADDVVVCDMSGKVIAGKYNTTFTEVFAHSEVYKKRKDINSVIHAHPAYVIALSMMGETVVPCDIQFPSVGPGPVPFYKNPVMLDKAQYAAEVADLIGEYKAVILRAHGILAVGKSIETSLYAANNVEHSAMLQMMARSAGKLVPLTKEEMAPLIEYRKRADQRPGTGADREFTYYSTIVNRQR